MAFMLTSPLASFAQEAGIIAQIRGDAYWKKDARSEPIKLHPKRDKGRLLWAGERLRCSPRSELWLQLYKRAFRVPCTSSWFPIPYVQADKSDPARQVLVTYGTRGGGERGESSIYSPSNGASVNPATFEVRWIPKPGQPVLSLLIREVSPSGREIFRQDVVDGMSGHISSKTVRRALAEYRDERGHGPLLIILRGDRREIASVRFFLLSAIDQEALTHELRSWNKKPEGIWRHLGIAQAFTRREMFTEAAEEYEAALKHAPDGIDLLRKTIAAHKRTGNTAREKELSARLAKLTNDLNK